MYDVGHVAQGNSAQHHSGAGIERAHCAVGAVGNEGTVDVVIHGHHARHLAYRHRGLDRTRVDGSQDHHGGQHGRHEQHIGTEDTPTA
jgi:hypothetical protein